MIFVGIQVISGLMFGIEIAWEEKALVLDIGIVRVIFQLSSKNK